ncbi:LysR family transcriptional regulator [Kovacikia minuta CCNUW1]|uniref:LysR family transcriptional regulator n=1 Tax=Kovacikia minuta TaxID=2931930 RepID=UPI001CCF51D5|nr:LysR family transcriptional regulator [Kovacikia minuta]UBF25995.1 LysR family transcriptional regulator [Kovacikia minuta CCNUW1]
MNLSQLRSMVAVADRGNFSEAALFLGLTQSSISHAIAGLEEELGVPLFLRGRHGATLTPAGERIVDYARQILQLLEQMQQEANLQKSLKGGQVRLATIQSVATHVLPTVIARFRHQFPDIKIAIMECPGYLEVEQMLREGRADIGFTHLPTTEEFETWEIMRDEYVVLVPPTIHINHESLSWNDIADYPLILPPDEQCSEIAFYQHLERLAPPLKIAHKIYQGATIVGMVAQGLGIGILPRLTAEPIPPNVRVFNLPAPYERVIGVAILSHALHVPAVFAFLDLLKHCDRKQVTT